MKSQSELNWVFILVAGAIILAFFTGFAFKYKSLQEEKTSIELLINLDNTLTNLKTSPYATFTEIKLPKEIEIECNEIKLNNKNIKVNNLLFSQKKLKNNILIYYKPFKLGFKVSDFYFIVSNKININTNNPDYLKKLIEELPEKIKQKITLNQGQGKMIKIDIANKKFNSYPLNEDLIYAFIFSDNFECVYPKIKKELEDAVSVYETKAMIMNKAGCNYSPFLSYLEKIKQFNLDYVKSVDEINLVLSGNDCPTLY